jgi:electron transfer flavoprotein beta subunit
MRIVVPIRFVPDLVEELEIDDSGVTLDETWMTMILNELDDHAIEQAVLIKEHSGAHVTVLTLEAEGCDDVLATAAAKGVDQLIKVTGDGESGLNSHALARQMAKVIEELDPDLVLTGVQAHNDLDGQLGPLLAGYLGLPYVGYIAGVAIDDGKIIARKEYPGGLIAEMEVELPAVLGIQAAEEPPRYVAFSRINQAKKTATIEDRVLAELDQSGGPVIDRMYPRDVGKRATMIEGDAEEIADRILQIIAAQGIS